MNATNGSIVVCHDSEKAFPRLKILLPDTLNFLKNVDSGLKDWNFFECNPERRDRYMTILNLA
jgi:hypothetical protein